MEFKSISSLIEYSYKIAIKVEHAQNDFDRCNGYFLKYGGYDNFIQSEEARAMLKYYEAEYDRLQTRYDELSHKKLSKVISYGVTIGSAEKSDIGPCIDIFTKFVHSADCKKNVCTQAYFEKGDSGYIHIHMLVTRSEKWPRSLKQLAKRHGKYKNKQHNFDVVPLKTPLDISKWGNYIKKDCSNIWNQKVNEKLTEILNSLKKTQE